PDADSTSSHRLKRSFTCYFNCKVEAEERRTNLHLREEQDAAYRAALEADQARESQRQEEEERLEREAAEERKTARVRMRPEKALSLGANLRKYLMLHK
ncbi:unnamed protein product, partial [Brassica napus]